MLFFIYIYFLVEIFFMIVSTVVPRFLTSSLFKHSVFDQKIRAKNASEFKQNFSVQTLRLGTKKSQVESKRTPHSISQERKEASGAKMHSADRFLIKMVRFLIKEKRKATAQPDSPPKKREVKKPLKESYPASFRSLMLFRYRFS